jgi:hypothetical protein
MIHEDQPELVVEAIQRVVEAVGHQQPHTRPRQ